MSTRAPLGSSLAALDALAVEIEPAVEVEPCPVGLDALEVVRWLLSEHGFRLTSRCLDKRWDYAHVFDAPLNVGFDPFGQRIFVPRVSSGSAWLADPGRRDLARLNLGNRLLGEVLFAVHDLFHMWAYRRMSNHPQGFELGRTPLRAETLDDYAFCHLVSEAVATVGLDYWYLSRRSLDELLELPLGFRGLTVSYTREVDERLARHTGLTVESPEFFTRICTLYLTGRLPGIDRDVLVREPEVGSWLRHELSYSLNQRLYTYSWLSFLAGLDEPSRERALAPIDCELPWRARVLEDVGEALWRMTRAHEYALEPHHEPTGLPPIDESRPDPRFVNPTRFRLERASSEHVALYQRLLAATYDFDSFTPAQRRELAATPSLHRYHELLERGRPHERHDEPWLLFQLN